MLQRKLLARLGLLVVGFITGAVVSIVLLQGVLKDLDRMSADATAIVDGARDVGGAIEEITDAVRRRTVSRASSTNDVAAVVAEIDRLAATLNERIVKLGRNESIRNSGALASIGRLVPAFVAAARSGDAGAAKIGSELRGQANDLGAVARKSVAQSQAGLSRELRYLIIGLCVAALVMMNVTILVLLRTANMVLRPVGELVEASRQLAQEQFTYRVRDDRGDEFGELARAYNSLAGQLGANEQRKVEALQHLAVTLNHEVNNAINTIDLQLSLMDRRSGGDPVQRRQLQGIHENLRRITGTIASLKNVRRVVLTDYAPGEKMLDLVRSVADESPTTAQAPGRGTAARQGVAERSGGAA